MSLGDDDILNLPEAPDFISKKPEFTMEEMIAMCKEMLPFWNKIRYSAPEPEYIGEAFTL